MSEQAIMSKVNENAAASGMTVLKLIVFSLSLGILPISSYFGSLKYIWHGNATYAAITAVVSANIVLVAYIISSLREDGQAGTALPKQPTETKKSQ